MSDHIKQKDVPESQLGRLPWGEPLDRWTAAMLERAVEDGHLDDTPRLAAAIRHELSGR